MSICRYCYTQTNAVMYTAAEIIVAVQREELIDEDVYLLASGYLLVYLTIPARQPVCVVHEELKGFCHVPHVT